MNKYFSKILIANRGEIALRIIRAARTMGIATVAIYVRGEEKNLHVLKADDAVCLGEGDLNDTYLNREKILFIAKSKAVDAIHPGYGFLSESAEFAQDCFSNNITFIGPTVDVLEKMGNKITAKEIAQSIGINVLSSRIISSENLNRFSEELFFPLLIKAAHGGGGKGMQIVRSQDEMNEKVIAASRSALSYFGNGEIYIEDYIENARHIEVQLLGDSKGNIIHLYERDCTIQRNHQKIIEEAPASSISSVLRSQLHEAALKIGHTIGFQNAGTVEFLVDAQENFYFLEMNPRIQVEHPVTEEVTGVDIVSEQLSIAAGNALRFSQKEISVTGHSIEARIYQEDPVNDFSPSTSPVDFFQFPTEQDLRIESDLKQSEQGLTSFDPLLAKFIVKSPSREQAMMHLSCSLTGVYINGPSTNVNYLNAIINHPDFFKNKLTTEFCEKEHSILLEHSAVAKNQIDLYALFAASILFNHQDGNESDVWNSIGFWRFYNRLDLQFEGHTYSVRWKKYLDGFQLSIDNHSVQVSIKSKSENAIILKVGNSIEYLSLISLRNGQTTIGVNGFIYDVRCMDLLSNYPEIEQEADESAGDNSDVITSHLFGKIVSVNVKKNQKVKKGEVLLVIESMKSENAVKAPKSAKIDTITVAIGSQVKDQMPLVYLKE